MRNPHINHAQRLLMRIKLEDKAIFTEVAQVKPVWDGKDSLDAFIESANANKYLKSNKANVLLGLNEKQRINSRIAKI